MVRLIEGLTRGNAIHGRQRPRIANSPGENLIEGSDPEIAEDPEARRTQSG